MREGNWKLALADGERAQLYDLADDHAESRDVAREHPEVVARLTRLAREWTAPRPEKPDPACVGPTAPGP